MKKILKTILAIILAILTFGAFIIVTNISRPFNASKIASESKITGISCMKDNTKQKYEYKPCDKDFKASDWVRYIELKNSNSNNLLLYLDGGPLPDFTRSKRLVPSDDDVIKEFFIRPEQQNYDVAFVKEIWQMKHNLLMNGMKISIQDTQKEAEEYARVLDKIIKHYQNQGKTVVLAGHSYGGNQIHEYLRVVGTSADGVSAFSTRLAAPKSQADLWKKRIMTNYNYDGSPNDPITALMFVKLAKFLKPADFIVTIFDGYSIGYDFTKAIDPKKLTHKNIYWYSAYGDLPAGSFTQKEIDFARKYGQVTYLDEKQIDKEWEKLKEFFQIDDESVVESVRKEFPHGVPFWNGDFFKIVDQLFANAS